MITETWAGRNIYCITCSSPRVVQTPANRPAVDFLCPLCDAAYQLKSSVRPFSWRIVDGAYESMLRAIEQDSTPNLLLLSYELTSPVVRELEFIPKFALTKSSLQRRPPLSLTARRAGWVGCNILVSNIPPDARIALVRHGRVTPPNIVRAQYLVLKPLSQLELSQRGWTLDVLNAVRSLEQNRFSLADVYAFETQLATLHPLNRNVRPKIRQQLQVLRDVGLIEFISPGQYRLREIALG